MKKTSRGNKNAPSLEGGVGFCVFLSLSPRLLGPFSHLFDVVQPDMYSQKGGFAVRQRR